MRIRTTASYLAALATLAVALPGRAGSAPGFAVNRFEPSERGGDWFANESLDLRGAVRPALGVVADYSYRSLVIYDRNDEVEKSVVRNDLRLHLGGSLVLFERLRLAMDLPLQTFADGHAGSVDGLVYAPPPREQGVGDLRAGVDVRLLGRHGESFTLAVGAQAFAPTGDRAQYTSDGEWRLRPRLMAAGDIGAFVYSAQVAYRWRDHDDRLPLGGLGDELEGAMALGARVADGRLVVGPELWASTSTRDAFARDTTPVEAILGAHYRLAEQLRLGAGVGTGLTRGRGGPEARGLLSVEWMPGHTDAREASPVEPPPPPPIAPPADRDGDGIPDAIDACPDIAGMSTDDPLTRGCKDSDGDGVFDNQDACPAVRGIASSDPLSRGCADTDGDGVFDRVDACPKEPGPASADPATNGCPDTDRDRDGVADDVDACPDEPGKPDPDPRRSGCPKAFVKQGQIQVLDQVKFATGSAQIAAGKDSEEVLVAVLEVLKAHPEILRVRVEGHTDSTGAAAPNKKLSGDRAAGVVKWLVAHGIAADRLTSQGLGAERPIDSNTTADGRKNNRRVELHIE